MLLTSLIPAVVSEAASAPAVSPWLIGLGIFTLLVAVMVALLMFGAGRDHS